VVYAHLVHSLGAPPGMRIEPGQCLIGGTAQPVALVAYVDAGQLCTVVHSSGALVATGVLVSN
jgi:hypothetical protein